MVTQTIVITEKSGLHLRPSARISEVSLAYQCKVQIRKENRFANAKSILGVLALRVQQDDEIEILCEGADEEEAIVAIIKVIKDEFCLTSKL